MTENGFRFFEFGEFRLDAYERTLQKNGEPVHLTPRIFDLLLVMVENAGRVLEHDELLDKVWEGAFVEQTNLKKSVSTLRQALGESPEASRFIKTIPRRGYSFTASVRPLPDAPEIILVRETKAEFFVEEEIEDKDAPLLLATKKTGSFPLLRIAIVIGAIFLLSSVIFAAWFFLRKQPQRFSIENARITRVFSADNVGDGTFSKDGKFFVYTLADKNGKNGLWVRQETTGSAVQVVPPMNASFWFFTLTPDNNNIYSFINNRDEPAKSGIYKIPTFGGAPPQLITEKAYGQLDFSPDGKRLAVVRTFVNANLERQELLTIKPDGTDEKVIITLPDYHLIRGLAWSSDGASLFYGVKKQPPFEKPLSYVAEIPSTGGAEKIIMPMQESLFFVEDCMPDNNSILLRQRESNAESYQLWQYFLSSGEVSRVTNDDYSYTNSIVMLDGKRVGAFRNFRLTSIWIAESDRDNFRQIATGSNNFHNLEWTPDSRLVFSTMENASEYVAIINSDGSEKRLLTNGKDGIRLSPSVSRDGKHIVFISSQSGSKQVFRIDLDGRNSKQLANAPEIGAAKLLSDGQTIIYKAYVKTKTWSLIKQTADGKTVQLTDTDTIYWDVSPDEKYLAIYALDEKTNKYHLFVRDMETGSTVKTLGVEGIESLHWTPDGKALSFIRIGDDHYKIVLLPLDDKPERVLTTVRGEQILNFAWSSDGKQIALVRSKIQNDAVLIQTETGK